MLDYIKTVIQDKNNSDDFKDHFMQYIQTMQDVSIEKEINYFNQINPRLTNNDIIELMNNLVKEMGEYDN